MTDVGAVEILLVVARKRPDHVFPKGGWETDETAEEAALRECWEEAGCKGELICQLACRNFPSQAGKDTNMTSFLMHVQRQEAVFPEAGERANIWVSIPEAQQLVIRDEMKEMLTLAVAALATRGFAV